MIAKPALSLFNPVQVHSLSAFPCRRILPSEILSGTSACLKRKFLTTFFSSFTTTTTMLTKDIAEMTAYNQKADGSYDELQDELTAFVSAGTSLKSLATKLQKAIFEYDNRIAGQAQAKVSILGKGQETATQFTPGSAFRTALNDAYTAVNNAFTAYGAIDLPTA